MTRWLRRSAATLVAASLVLGVLPQASAAHCEAAPRVDRGHHDSHHQKDIERAEQCPHCPPAACQRHVQCGFGLDLSIEASPSGPERGPEGGRYLATPRSIALITVQPPTPPPQIDG